MIGKLTPVRIAAAVMFTALAAACGEGDGPAAPDLSPQLALGDLSNQFSEVVPGVVKVCAFNLGDGPDGTAEFDASATAGDFSPYFTIPWYPHCYEAWNFTGSVATFTATLFDAYTDEANLVAERIFTFVGDGVSAPVSNEYLGAQSASVEVSGALGAEIWFKLAASHTPPEENGGAGCTPGFWRQPHHYQYWTGSSPEDGWTTVFADPGSHESRGRFAETFNGGSTLGQAVEFNGGGIFALARHAVAALLNARSSDVDYDLSEAEIVDLVNSALASGDYESAKNVLEEFNEQGCSVVKTN